MIQPRNLLVIVMTVIALIALATSAMTVLQPKAATPSSAASDVSPLSFATDTPVAQTSDARLPPLLGTGTSVSVHLVTADAAVAIASGVSYQAWTFNGTVPGPILHVRQGQTVNVTLTNRGTMPHSIDLHAAQVPPNVAYHEVNPGESATFSFVATTPGVFLYHCGTAPTLLHLGNGMYGAMIVDPSQPLPPADASYVLVQGEWYTRPVQGTEMAGNWNKMLADTPDEVVFNGTAFQYRDHPLVARAGQRVRLYVVDAGPNLPSAFHVVGAIFAAIYPDGDPSHVLNGVSTYQLAPGQGAVFDLVIPRAGNYPFVDHSMRDMELGAQGQLNVTP